MKFEVINIEGNQYKKSYMDLMDYVYNPSAHDYFEGEWEFLTPEHGTILGVVDEQNQIMNTASILNKEMVLNGHLVKMGGIACVGSMGHARGGGVIRKMMQECLSIMNNQDMAFSLLGPFKYEFYEKFGYKLCFERYKCTVPMNELKTFKSDRNYVLVNEQNVKRVQAFYHQMYKGWNGACTRSIRDLYRTLDTSDKWRGVMIENKAGEIEGYMIFKLNHDEGAFAIREFVSSTPKAVHALFNYAYLHEAQFQKMVLYSFPKDQIMDYLINPSADFEIETGMMARIVNVKKALATYPFVGTGHVILNVIDETCEWNNQCFEVTFNHGEIISVIESHVTPQIEIHIKELSQLVMGYRTLSDLIKLDRVSVKDLNVCKYFQLMRQPVALYDFF